VNTDVLNIRSGPSFTHRIISKTYLGNLVFAYAKKGEWVAIRPEFTSAKHGIYTRPQWVNKNYLTAIHIKGQVDTEVLKGKCSFAAYGTYPVKIRERSEKGLSELASAYDACGAVRVYLS